MAAQETASNAAQAPGDEMEVDDNPIDEAAAGLEGAVPTLGGEPSQGLNYNLFNI